MRKIGSLKLGGEVFLAPMADYTNVAFRALCREYGAALLYTELISAKGICMKNKKTAGMLRVSEKEKPVFLQLFGNTPADFKKAIEFVEKKFPDNFAGYDLNAGCSVPKALKGKYGCVLMNDAQNAGRIIGAMKSACEKPISIKMRLGLKEETFLEVAKEAERAGVDAITLHPRFGFEGYGGTARWEKIAELKKQVSVPVIGNGDIKVPEDAVRMKKETRCDFEMIGRASIGNAFFFKQADAFLRGKKVSERTQKEVALEGKKFLELVEEFELGVNDARGYFLGMVKGTQGAAQIRNKIGLAKSVGELEEIIFER